MTASADLDVLPPRGGTPLRSWLSCCLPKQRPESDDDLKTPEGTVGTTSADTEIPVNEISFVHKNRGLGDTDTNTHTDETLPELDEGDEVSQVPDDVRKFNLMHVQQAFFLSLFQMLFSFMFLRQWQNQNNGQLAIKNEAENNELVELGEEQGVEEKEENIEEEGNGANDEQEKA